MKVFEELTDGVRVRKYGAKAKEVDVSFDLLCGNAMNYGIPIHKMVEKAVSKEDFHRKVRTTLYGSDKTDFYDFSLLMGLYFGVYNSYGYLYIDSDIKKEVLETNPNYNDTSKFLSQYQEAICQYFHDFYGFSSSKTKDFIEKMGTVFTDGELYHETCVEDLGKLLMGVSLFYDKEEVDSKQVEIEKMISSGVIISEFNHKNEIQTVQSTGFKR